MPTELQCDSWTSRPTDGRVRGSGGTRRRDESSRSLLRRRPWLRELHKAAYAFLSQRLYDERSDAWQRGFFAARIAHPVDLFILDRNGEDVGAVYLEQRPDELYIESIEVLPDRQRQGNGSAALSWVVQRAAQAGQVVTLQVHKGNPGAQRLYERHGFAVVGQTDTHVRLQTISAQTSPLELVAQDGNLWPTSEIPHSDAAS